MADKDYLIQIRLIARDMIGPAVAKAAAELEGLKKVANSNDFAKANESAQKFSNTIRDKVGKNLEKVEDNLHQAGKESDRLSQKLANLQKRTEETNRTLKSSQGDLERLGKLHSKAAEDVSKHEKALSRFGKTTDRNSDKISDHERLLGLAQQRLRKYSSEMSNAERVTSDLNKITSDLNKTQAEHDKALERSDRAYRKQIDAVVKLRDARRRIETDPVASKGFDFNSLDREIDKEQRKLAELAAEMEALSRQKITVNMNLDDGAFKARLGEVEAEKAILGSDVHVNVDLDIAAAEAKLAAFEVTKRRAQSSGGEGGFLNWVRQVGHEAEQSRSSVAAFDNAIRGIIVLAAVALAQPLITVLMALGAELIAVASSAIMAGSALGGALVAGVAQALPVVGLLVAAFARFGAVLAAVKQNQLVQQQQSYEGGKAAKAQSSSTNALANANDSLKSAIEGVASAKQNLILAEVGLNRTRFESRRQLQDLILQERSAELAAKGAALSQLQAGQALQEAVTEGRIGDIASAELEVSSSRLNTRQAQINAERSRQDVNLQRSGSPLRPDTSVEDAQRQVGTARKSLEAAKRAVDQAKRGIDQAKTSANEAAGAALSSAGKFNYMLSKLDDAEKRLYQGVNRLYSTYKKVFRPITDIIINSFTFAVNRVDQLLHDPKLIAGFTGLAKSIGSNMDRITSMFTSPTWARFFTTMTKEAAQNLGPLTKGFISLANAFRSIAEAASPILRDIVKWFAEGAAEFQKWVGGGKHLTNFFREGEKHLEAWGQLAGAIVKLFLALIGTSAKEGLSTVRSLTRETNKATEYINTHRKAIEHFFDQVGDVMSVLGKVVLALGREIFKSFDPKAAEALGDVLIRIVIPALGEAVRLFGQIIIVIDKLLQNPLAATLAKWAIGFAIAKAVMNPFIGGIKGLLISIRSFSTIIGGALAKLLGVSATAIEAEGPLAVLGSTALITAGAIAAAIAAFIFLSAKFGVLDDEIKAVKETFGSMKKSIEGPLKDLGHQLSELGKSLGIVGDKSSFLGGIFKSVFVNTVLHVIIPAVKYFYELIGKQLGGVLTVIAGIVEIITGILTLNFHKILEGLGKVTSGLTAGFRFMFSKAWDLVKGGVKLIITGIDHLFSWMIDKAKDLPGLWWKGFTTLIKLWASLPGRLLHAIISGFPVVWDWLKSLPGKMVHFASKAISAVVGMFESLGPKILHAIGSIASDLVNAGKKLGEKLGEGLEQAVKDIPILGKVLELSGGALKEIVSHIPGMEEGGPVGSGFGGGDRVHLLAEEGEHMLTKDEVRNAGGHGAIFALRQLLGGGTQGGGGRFAKGGVVKGKARQASLPDAGEADISIGLETLLEQIGLFGTQAMEAWDGIWNGIQKRTAEGIDSVIYRVREMQKVTTNQLGKLENAFQKTAKSIGGDMQDMDQVVYKGLNYIVNATNKSLSIFGGKKINLSLQAPGSGKGKAEGGFLGNQGERGEDGTAYIPGGRGEAVLNWAHQKMVEPAMHAYYKFGLPTLFKKTKGEHASGRPGGYAGGGYIYPFNSQWTMGRTDQGVDFAPSSSGAPIAAVGDARILGTGAPGWPGGGGGVLYQLLSGSLAKKIIFVYESIRSLVHAGQMVKAGQLIGRGFTGGTGIEMGFADASGVPLSHGEYSEGDETIWGKRMHQFLVGLSGGKEAGFFGQRADLIKKLMVHGPKGALKDLAQGSLDIVRKAANKYIGRKSGITARLGSLAGITGNIPEIFAAVAKRLASPFRSTLALFEAGLAESGMKDLPGGDSSSQGVLQLLASTAAGLGVDPHDVAGVARLFLTRGFFGRGGAIKLAKTTPEAAYEIAQDVQGSGAGEASHGASNYGVQKAAALALMRRYGIRIPRGYAQGGIIGGPGGTGSPMPILAHLGEWILNPRQQLRIAKLMGTTVDKLKGMLGFSGGPTSFAGGGEPKQQGLSSRVSVSALEGIYSEDVAVQVGKLVKASEKLTKKLAKELKKSILDVARTEGRLKPSQILSLELENLEKEVKKLFSKQGSIRKLIHAAEKELKTIRKISEEPIAKAHRELVKAQKGDDKKEIKKAQKAFKGEKEKRHKQEKNIKTSIRGLGVNLEEAEEETQDKQIEAIEKQEEILVNAVSEIGKKAERAISKITTWISKQSAKGFAVDPGKIKEQISTWETEQRELEGKLAEAHAVGNQELAEQIEGEIEGLEVSVAEAAASMIQNAEQAIETTASRAKFKIEIGNRIAGVREHFGNLPGVQEMRGGLLHKETGVISQQMSETQTLLTEALAEGFGPDIIIPLQEKIEDLGVQLEENGAALYANTIAVRAALLEQVTNRQSFMGGISGTLETIVTGLGNISGVVNQAKIIELISGAASQLSQTSTGIRDVIGKFVGEEGSAGRLTPAEQEAIDSLIGMHGEELVTAIQGLDFEEIIGSLGVGSEGAKQFEELINAMLENEAAIIQNTEALKQANQQNEIQSFTSTAWQWFRKAIFTGMGGLLPQYAEGTPFYHAASGGEMTTDGPVHAHRGELIIPADFSAFLRRLSGAQSMAAGMGSGIMPGAPLGIDFSSQRASGIQAQLAAASQGGSTAAELSRLRRELASRSQEINVEVNEADPSDPTYLANRLAFAVRTPAT